MPKSRLGIRSALMVGCITILAGQVRGEGDEPMPHVNLLRVLNGGIQPQVAVDRLGTTHMIYFLGEPENGDIFYVRMSKSGERFTEPIRVNSTPGSAMAIGNIRGAQLALGKNGRVHVAWNGSGKAVPRGPHHESPMIYTRLDDKGVAFEPERNVIHSAYGLDGGGSVAADDSGNVYVAWHAPKPGMKGEENRCVWVAHSTDEGRSFAPEQQAFAESTGACGCCGMSALADSRNNLFVLFRSATELVQIGRAHV